MRLSNVMPFTIGTCLVAFGLILAGCESKPIDPAPAAPPGPTYTGPAYLRGTIGSLTRVRNNQAIPISGYGLVVGLHGTGSSETPAGLRNWLINEMKKQGVGSVKYPTMNQPPADILAAPSTAVVAVQGFIPPGATPGTRFDVLVSALPGTQTTSLAGGQLFTTQMALNGLQMASRYSKPLAKAHGPMYQNPYDQQRVEQESKQFRRQAMVIRGGKVTEPRRVELVLNQPSYSRSRAISDRINERFGMGPDDRMHETADAKSDSRIVIHVPKRFASRPQRLLALINHLFIERSPKFIPMEARRLFERLKSHPEDRQEILLAWKALGKMIIPVLREYYDQPTMRLRMAALQAGAYHEDGQAGQRLLKLAEHDDPAIRRQAAEALVHLSRSIDAARALKDLLDDGNLNVRLAAYESLAENNDPIIERMPIADKGGFKFVIDRVPAKRPLVYITQEDFPRLVLFGPQLGFKPGLTARLWDNRLMLRTPNSIPQAMVGVKPGKVAFVPVYGRGEIRELDARWISSIRDGQGHEAELQIDSHSLLDQFEKQIQPSNDQVQTLAKVRLIEPNSDRDNPSSRYKLRLAGFRSAKKAKPITVYYQQAGTIDGKTYKISPTVATFAYMLAHEPTENQPQEGLDLNYSQVVDAVYHLCKQGAIPAPIQVTESPLARLVTRYDQLQEAGPNRRPETGSTP